MTIPDTTNSFLGEARRQVSALHQSIEAALCGDDASRHAALARSSARAGELARTLLRKAETADPAIKAALAAAASHADAAAAAGRVGRTWTMIDQTRKLARRISGAVAHVRTHATGVPK